MSADRYLKEMFARFGYFAAWLPNTRVALGDVGVFDGKRFTRKTSLGLLQIPFGSATGGTRGDLSAQSTSGVKLQLGASVDAGAGASGNARLEFSEKGGFVFQARGLRETVIADLHALGGEIVGAFRLGEWQENWAVIDCVGTVDTLSVFIGESEQSSIELGGLLPGELPLVRSDAQLSIAGTTGSMFSLVGSRNATPLFRASRLKRSLSSFYQRVELGSVRSDGEPAPPDADSPALEPVTIDNA